MGRAGITVAAKWLINKNTLLFKECNRLTIETVVKVFVFTFFRDCFKLMLRKCIKIYLSTTKNIFF